MCSDRDYFNTCTGIWLVLVLYLSSEVPSDKLWLLESVAC